MKNIKILKIMDLGSYLIERNKNIRLGIQLIFNPESFDSKMEMPDTISRNLKKDIERI